MAKKRAEDQTFNKIKLWAIGEEDDIKQLSEKDKELFDRWDEIDNLLKIYPSKKHVVNIIKRKYGISTSTAYQDIDYSKRLFNSIDRVEKDFIKRFLIEDMMLLLIKARGSDAGVNETGEVVEARSPDFKAWNHAHSNLIKLLGFDRSDNQTLDPSIFEQNNYYTVIQVGGKLLRVDEEEFHKLPVANKNDLIDGLFPIITEDIAYEMIEEKDGEEGSKE